MNLKCLRSPGLGLFCVMGAIGAASACSDRGPTYVIYAGGSAGIAGSTASGGSSAGTDPGSGGASGGTDPGSGGTDPGSGGTDPGSGGASGGSAGNASSGGSDATGGTGNAGGTGNVAGSNAAGGSGGFPQTNIPLIDDFADCDGQIRPVDGRVGAWYSLNVLNTATFGPPPSSGWYDTSCGAFLAGACSGCDVAGLAAILAPGAYDLSGYTGIAVTFESEASLFIAVKTTNGSNYGYLRSDVVTSAPTGGTRTVYFDSMTPDLNYHGLAWAQEIHFTLDDYSKEYGFGLGIHRVELVSN